MTVVFFGAEEAGRVTVRGGRRNYTPACHTRSIIPYHRHTYLQPQTVYKNYAYRSETINKNWTGVAVGGPFRTLRMVSPLPLIVTL